jgi:cyclophilin family peptidyl-prolyl cis-trans isomerase
VATEKRARKKQYRDQRQAALQAAYRRRRLVRLTAVLVVLAIVVALGLSFGNSEDANDTANPPRTAQPSATESDAAPAPTGEVACGGEKPRKANPKQYDAPEDVLEDGVDYAAVITTSCGKIELDLFEDDAPETVNSFVFLAGEGYFDGLTWHRIVGNFVIQSGDPDGVNGQEPDGPGYSIKDELPSKSNVYTFGAVAMANAGADTGGSQFFIVTHQGPDGETDVPAGLQPDFALFGQVDKGSFDVVEEIGKLPTLGGDDPATADSPRNPVYIESIKIVEG